VFQVHSIVIHGRMLYVVDWFLIITAEFMQG